MSAIILAWPRHHRSRCGPECHGCFCCNGGLFLCTRCGGAEGSLPTDCPGERMSQELDMAVYGGRVDYLRDRGWISLGGVS
jgi:hypothetical protein